MKTLPGNKKVIIKLPTYPLFALQGKLLSAICQNDIMKFTVILQNGEDGYIIAHVPALKGCHTQGKARNEAFANAK